MSRVKVLSVGSTALAPARENTVMPLRPKFAAAGSSVAVGLLAALLGAFPVLKVTKADTQGEQQIPSWFAAEVVWSEVIE